MRDAMEEARKYKMFKWYSLKAKVRVKVSVWLYKLSIKIGGK